MSTACSRLLSLARTGLGITGFVGIVIGGACSSNERETEQFPTGPGGGSSQIVGLPEGWGGGTSRPDQYELGRDVEIVHGGTASAYLRSKTAQPSEDAFITLTQGIRADFLRGHRVRLSGYLRVRDAVGAGAGLWLRGDAPRSFKAFDNMDGRRRTGTGDWSLAEVVVDIPDDVVGIAFGALHSGPGTAWIDDLRLEIVDLNVPVTAQPTDVPTGIDSAALVSSYARVGVDAVNLNFEGVLLPESQAATIDWVRTNSVQFLTDDPESGDADLASLRTMIGSSRLVALGEATHGTREFFRMKHRVFAWLVRNLGFTQFSIEASLPEALAVEQYVQTGIGDPAMVVRGMYFWTWSTEEVIALVQWMRAWNAAGSQPRVHFTGFDMQYPGVAIDSVVSFTSAIDAALGDTVRGAYSCLTPYRNNGPNTSPRSDLYGLLPVGDQDACRDQLSSVDSLFARRIAAWSLLVGEDRASLMQRLARLVSQWESYARLPSGPSSAARDRFMAENVSWWRSRTSATGGMMLWAHNLHVSRVPPWMGSVLAEQHGADYLNVALTFSRGTFNAVNRTATGTFTGLQVHGLAAPWPSSIEAMFSATGLARSIFDTRAVTSGGTAAVPLQRRLTMRVIGSTFAPSASPAVYQSALALPEDYDLVIWFRDASASRLSLSASSAAVTAPDSPP
ncbi:MAG TPA: erythromycin esterase family protein [Gemmatimonadaceae bacterium]